MMYQNLSWQPKYIQEDGCFAVELVSQAELDNHSVIPPNRALRLWEGLNAQGFLGTEASDDEIGAYVYHAAEVYNRASSMLGGIRRVKYIGTRYTTDYRAKYPDLQDWGTTVGADWVLLHVTTRRGNGHFRGIDHDPWEGGAGVIDVKSVRYFRYD